MKHTKKCLALLLALLLLVGLLPTAALADNTAVISVGKPADVTTGETVTVPVTISNNPGFTYAYLQVGYDAETLELQSVAADLSGMKAKLGNDNIVELSALDDEADLTGNGGLLTLTFKALKAGSSAVSLGYKDNNSGNMTNAAEAAVPVTFEASSVTVTESVTPAISVGSPAEVPAGDLVMVPVTISDNPGFTSAGLKVSYDTEMLELQGVTAGFGELLYAALDGSVITLNAKGAANINENGLLFTMAFKTLKAGTTSVSLGYNGANGSSITNAAGAPVSVSFAAGTVTVAEADPSESGIQTFIKFVGGTGKLYAKEDTEKAVDFLSGLTQTGDTYTLKIPAGDYVFEGYKGTTFLGSIELNVSEGHSDFSGDYGDHGKLFPVTIYNTDTSWVYGTDFTFENLRVVSGGMSTPTQRVVTMADSETANRKTILVHEGDTITVDLVPMGTKASTYATKSGYRTCNVGYDTLPVTPVSKNTTAITYPYADTNGDGENDFNLEFGILKSGTYYIFDYYTPADVSEPKDGTVTATFNTAKSTYYFYKVSNPLDADAVSYANYVQTGSTAEGITVKTVTPEQMYIGDSSFNKGTVIRDYVTNNQYDSGDLYLATSDPNFVSRDGFRGMIQLDTDSNSSCTLYPYRNWLIIEGISNARMIQPDFHVEVVTLEGDNPITVTENTDNTAKKHSYEIQANGTGTAVLFVTYDAIQADHAYGKPKFFSAIRPENTGVLVVTVNGTEAVDANMRTPAEKVNTDMDVPFSSGTGATGLSTRKAGANLDAELDVLYFLTDEGASYSFTPEAGTVVTMAKAVQNGTVTFSADGVSTMNGVVTLSGIPEGKTIVKLVNGSRVSYQVIRATRTNLTVTDAEGNVYYDSAAGIRNDDMTFSPGDKLTLTYSKLEQPAQKLSGVYNMAASVVPYGEGMEVKPSVASSGNYSFNSTPSRWTTTATIPATAIFLH